MALQDKTLEVMCSLQLESDQTVQGYCKAVNYPQLHWGVRKETDRPCMPTALGLLAAQGIAALCPARHKMGFQIGFGYTDSSLTPTLHGEGATEAHHSF